MVVKIMVQDANIIDLLIIEDKAPIVDLLQVLTKKFNLKVKYARNTEEFLNLAKINNFKFVLCDLNLGYSFEGLFIARVFANIRTIKQLNSKILLLNSEKVSEFELNKFGFDGLLLKEFLSIYEFLLGNFPLKSYSDLIKNELSYFASVSC